MRGVAAVRAGRAPGPHGGLAAAFGSDARGWVEGRIDNGFAALAMGLPSEADLARESGEDVDPDAIRVARRTMRSALGRAYAGGLAAFHAELAIPRPSAPTPPAPAGGAAQWALGLFVDGDGIRGLELAHRQLAEADNMTERLGALSAIAFQPDAARACARGLRPALCDGAAHPRQVVRAAGADPRARDARAGARLMNHHGFSLANPNRVRSLIGGFSANQTRVQPGRRRGLRPARGNRRCPRSDQSADRRAAADRHAILALARGGPPRPCQSHAEAHRRQARRCRPTSRDIVTRSLG